MIDDEDEKLPRQIAQASLHDFVVGNDVAEVAQGIDHLVRQQAFRADLLVSIVVQRTRVVPGDGDGNGQIGVFLQLLR